MGGKNVPFLIRTYFSARSWFEKAIALARACFVGLWLGVLTRERLHAIDEEHYTSTKRGIAGEFNFHSKEYNRRGLFDFEKKMITDYFAGCKRLLVIGAGGGREMLALRQLGYQVDGFECHPDLVAVANEVLQAEGYDSVVHLMPRDECPNTGATYDGIIIGWGMYMLVQGRERRIALLQQLRALTQAQGPILLSFFHRPDTVGVHHASKLVANMVRRLLRREPVELGDWLAPAYIHRFTKDEITSELAEGGFSTTYYSSIGYGHAVGIAV